MIYSVYEPNTGEITGHVSASSERLRDINLKGQSWVAGKWPARDYVIENGEPIQRSAAVCPDRSRSAHTPHDPAAWIRGQRRDKLAHIDRVNPVWWASLNADQQAELMQYRQDLLDVTKQSNFPHTVEWPQPPVWLG